MDRKNNRSGASFDSMGNYRWLDVLYLEDFEPTSSTRSGARARSWNPIEWWYMAHNTINNSGNWNTGILRKRNLNRKDFGSEE